MVFPGAKLTNRSFLRMGAAFILIGVFLGIFWLITWYTDLLDGRIASQLRSMWLFTSLAIVALGAFVLTAARLDLLESTERKEPRHDIFSREYFGEVKAEAAAITSAAEAKAAELRVLAVSSLKAEVAEAIASEYAPDIRRDLSAKSLAAKAEEFLAGLHRQIEKQRISTNVNLAWGILLGTGGLIVMAIFIVWPTMADQAARWDGNKFIYPAIIEKTWTSYLQQSLPRFGFVVIFESLSFFFLRAYGQDRALTRFLRNEATNVEARTIGLIAAIRFGDQAVCTSAIKSMMSTERNFTIRKSDKLVHEAFADEQALWVEKLSSQLLPTIEKALGIASRKPSRKTSVDAEA